MKGNFIACKVRELQEKLDHSQATQKTLESYQFYKVIVCFHFQ